VYWGLYTRGMQQIIFHLVSKLRTKGFLIPSYFYIRIRNLLTWENRR